MSCFEKKKEQLNKISYIQYLLKNLGHGGGGLI